MKAENRSYVHFTKSLETHHYAIFLILICKEILKKLQNTILSYFVWVSYQFLELQGRKQTTVRVNESCSFHILERQERVLMFLVAPLVNPLEVFCDVHIVELDIRQICVMVLLVTAST
jgi:hypothetical protein